MFDQNTVDQNTVDQNTVHSETIVDLFHASSVLLIWHLPASHTIATFATFELVFRIVYILY